MINLDLLGFVAISGVFLVMGLIFLLGVITLCKTKCGDK